MTGDEAFEAAAGFPTSLTLSGAPPNVILGLRVEHHSCPGNRVQRPVQLPIAVAVEPVPRGRAEGTAGRRLADVVLGRIPTPTGGYVDRDRVAPSSQESYNPERESELFEALERLTAELPSDVP